MSNRYVGHRYIPLFDGEWDKSKTYESLTFVHHQSKTYVSRQFVPTQIDIENNEFWAFFMEYTPEVFTPIFSGEWNNTKEYKPLSTVVNGDKTYFSKQFVPTGIDINNSDYWVDITTYYQNLLVDFEAAEQERQRDELIKVTGYIDGEYALNNKEMLVWTLALIRRNKNAIITLGGTV